MYDDLKQLDDKRRRRRTSQKAEDLFISKLRWWETLWIWIADRFYWLDKNYTWKYYVNWCMIWQVFRHFKTNLVRLVAINWSKQYKTNPLMSLCWELTVFSSLLSNSWLIMKSHHYHYCFSSTWNSNLIRTR